MNITWSELGQSIGSISVRNTRLSTEAVLEIEAGVFEAMLEATTVIEETVVVAVMLDGVLVAKVACNNRNTARIEQTMFVIGLMRMMKL